MGRQGIADTRIVDLQDYLRVTEKQMLEAKAHRNRLRKMVSDENRLIGQIDETRTLIRDKIEEIQEAPRREAERRERATRAHVDMSICLRRVIGVLQRSPLGTYRALGARYDISAERARTRYRRGLERLGISERDLFANSPENIRRIVRMKLIERGNGR